MNRLLTTATLNIATDMTIDVPDVADETDDAALMALIATGDRTAFNLFLSRHLTAVVQFARRYLSIQADAEDIAQETFLRVWRKATTWQPQGHSPRSWIYRIAYNLCIDEIRRRPANKTADETFNENTLYFETNSMETNSLEAALEKDSDLGQMARSLKLLPERQRTALSLCALQGLSNKEAATAMDISIEALESLLSRGRRQLRNSLQQDGENTHE